MTETSEPQVDPEGKTPEEKKAEEKRREAEGKTFGQKGTEVAK